MYSTVQLKCNKCGHYVITSVYGNKLDDPIEDYYFCDCEKAELEIVEFENIQEPSALLTWAELELEDANYHSQTQLPWAIYEAVSKYVDAAHHANLARSIAEVIVNNI